MRVDIVDPNHGNDRDVRSGYLMSLTGVGEHEVAELRFPIIKGYATVRDQNGIDQFITVNISENGSIFTTP